MFFHDVDSLVRTLLIGSLAYLTLIVVLRISGKRTLSKWNAFDFVVTVAFGSTLASLLLSQDTSLAQGVLAFALLVVWQFVITWLAVRVPLVRRWVKAKPTLLLFKGEFRDRALAQERVTRGEVRAALRMHGVGSILNTHAVVLETDGSFSVIEQPGVGESSLCDVEGYPEDRNGA